MRRQIHWSPEARQDAVEIAAFIGHDYRSAAIRFLDEIDATLAHLIAPGSGRVFPSWQHGITGVRVKSIRGFRNYLIFYRPGEDMIRVVRIVHGARDLTTLFDPNS